MMKTYDKYYNKIRYSPSMGLIKNADNLPHGTGSNYLECIKGQGEELIAKQWHKKEPKQYEVLVCF